MTAAIACPGCDLLLDAPALRHRECALCPRCGSFLTRYHAEANQRTLAFASAGLLLLLLACSYPFLTLNARGLESEMVLWQTPGALWDYGMPVVALLVSAFIIVIPAAVLTLLLLLCWPLERQVYRRWLPLTARLVFTFRSWSMAEVFIIGVIVSLVKLASMASVIPGVAFWAYAAFALCFTFALYYLDRLQCWHRIESLATG